MKAPIETEALVVGAGIVGLATAAALAERGVTTAIVERREGFGRETSSRSSEVVHAGLYYVPDSLKARLCVAGAAMVMARCRRLGIAHVERGKVVVARTHEQEAALATLRDNAVASGASGLETWGRRTLERLEPRVRGVAALVSRRTAVVDSHDLMRSFAADARRAGADLAFRHRLEALGRDGSRWIAVVADPSGERVEVRASIVVNSAGLEADRVAALAGVDVDAAGYRIRPCKGDWFSIAGVASRGLERLVYPLPEPALVGLGVHLTVDVAGRARLGPDATWVEPTADEPSYAVDDGKRAAFFEAGRRIVTGLRLEDLGPERSGIRPKLSGPGEPARDFVVRHEADRGLPGLVDLVGIESPGLTASPAIAAEVVSILERDGLV